MTNLEWFMTCSTEEFAEMYFMSGYACLICVNGNNLNCECVVMALRCGIEKICLPNIVNALNFRPSARMASELEALRAKNKTAADWAEFIEREMPSCCFCVQGCVPGECDEYEDAYFEEHSSCSKMREKWLNSERTERDADNVTWKGEFVND